MQQKHLFIIWGILFSLCASLGFIPEPEGLLKKGMTLISIFCFLPPFLILYRANKIQDRDSVRLIRNLSFLSLLLTLSLLVGNFLSVLTVETLGNILYYMLIIVSTPMISSGYWVLSLFLWACLLILSQKQLKHA